MHILIAVAALAAAQATNAAPVDHSKHRPAQHQQATGEHAKHEGEHKCCTEVNGKMECKMMKGHDAQHQGKHGKQGHEGHGTSH